MFNKNGVGLSLKGFLEKVFNTKIYYSFILSMKQSSINFLVFGPNGYFGSHIVKHLSALGQSYAVSHTRIEDRESIIRDLDFYNPKYVICAAGLAGTPNIVCLNSYFRFPN